MRILTGIQPSGKLHWGNYFGAMKSMFDLQAKGEDMFMFIANFHAMTTVRDGAALRESTREVALDYLACGLDPAKTIVYRQSDVPEVQELAWYLSCLTPMGLLERCHSYKDKMAHGFDATHGLFAYPVLMAADILIMQSDLVPVGKDQKQHLEVTRDLAIKFNNAYGESTLRSRATSRSSSTTPSARSSRSPTRTSPRRSPPSPAPTGRRCPRATTTQSSSSTPPRRRR